MFQPPHSFGIIQPQIYRANTIHQNNFPFIKTLGLKTILLLSSEIPTRGLMTFFEEIGVEVISLDKHVWRSNLGWRPCPEELIKEGLELLLDLNNHPLMIMCSTGIHESGTLVGCLRKLQGWNFNSILMEYQSFAGNKSRYVNEQFIELFDLDLITLPENLPDWMKK